MSYVDSTVGCCSLRNNARSFRGGHYHEGIKISTRAADAPVCCFVSGCCLQSYLITHKAEFEAVEIITVGIELARVGKDHIKILWVDVGREWPTLELI